MSAFIVLYPLNQQFINLKGLMQTDNSGNFVAWINNATVTATMLDQNGNIVAPINNVTLTSIDSTGDYSYTVPGTFNPIPNLPGYTLTITAVVSGAIVFQEVKQVSVVQRMAP